ncbi:MAG: sigma-54-dependent Fis family transcriptional regulator [Bacteroidetes bacterium]|nr:sigma-54-dependent Fis family transcriptional regulator [Bacteroidota bacterium]
MKQSILIIDDEEKLRSLLTRIISLEGYQVHEASTAAAGMRLLEREDIQVVISDVKLPDSNGVDLSRTIREKYPCIEVIVLTAFGTIADGVRAIKNGAFDYLVKGDDNEKILPVLSKALEKARLQKRVLQLEKRVADKYNFSNILGSSPAILAAKDLAQRVAPTDATVLLLGETGTGKEVFAQSIHEASERRGNTFLAVNCSALGREILESELFGHKAGAFTGAMKDKKGLLEEANGGTIFLDEIGEMSLDLQAKLLRVLETGEYIRVGDTRTTSVNVRVIAATNRDLKAESDQGLFRADLYYRLSVFQINIPSLDERRADIEVLAKHFIRVFADKVNKAAPVMQAAFLTALQGHRWRGNIRELKNVIERAVILSQSELTPAVLPFDFKDDTAQPLTYDLAEMERRHIQMVLEHTHGNKTEAARLLNIALATLYRKLKEYSLD